MKDVGSRAAAWLLPGAVKDEQRVTSAWDVVGTRPIEGVALRDIRPVIKGNGSVIELFRRDWFDASLVDQVFQVTLQPGGLSAWHAHEHTTDRLIVSQGSITLVLFDSRPDSPTYGLVNDLQLSALRPTLVTVPPQVWHGVKNTHAGQTLLVNLPDRAYCYESPDHWRVPADSPSIPYRFTPIDPARAADPFTPGR